MIGIITPYGRTETTTAACRLADLVTSLGVPLKLIGCSPNERRVHPYWDSRVVSCRYDGIYKATMGCSTVVHFDLNSQWVDQVKLVAEKSRQLLVLPWSIFRAGDEQHFKLYDQIICPSKAQYDELVKRIFAGGPPDAAKLTWCRWDSGLPAVRREGTICSGMQRALFFCDGAAVDLAGGMTVQLIDELLGMNKKLEITILSTKSWGNRDRCDLNALVRSYEPRLRYKKDAGHAERLKAYHDHDWVVFPGLRSDFAIHAAQALACGAPCVVYNVEVYNERVMDGRNGVVVPCEVRVLPPRGPMAVPDAGRFLSTMATALVDPRILCQLQDNHWNLEEQTKAFNAAMCQSMSIA